MARAGTRDVLFSRTRLARGESSWVSTRVKNENLVWCDKDGNEWSDDKEMNKARRSGKGYVKISDSYTSVDTIGLPAPFVLTWIQNGMSVGSFIRCMTWNLSVMMMVIRTRAIRLTPLMTAIIQSVCWRLNHSNQLK